MDYNFTGKTILIVEDEEVSQFFFEKSLKKTNANLLFANDGLESIKIVESNAKIDLVLMDIRLPLMNGIEATLKIKQINPDIPIIIQTAYALESAQAEALENGCDDFITKPIQMDTLFSIIHKHLNTNLPADKKRL